MGKTNLSELLVKHDLLPLRILAALGENTMLTKHLVSKFTTEEERLLVAMSLLIQEGLVSASFNGFSKTEKGKTLWDGFSEAIAMLAED